MPELILEIGGRVFEVACEAGQEASLQKAASLLDAEAGRILESASATTEKRLLLLSGLMLADTMAGLQDELRNAAEVLRASEERVRIAEAKAAMLAANAAKSSSSHPSLALGQDAQQLIAENEAAVELLSKVLSDLNEIADQVEAELS